MTIVTNEKQRDDHAGGPAAHWVGSAQRLLPDEGAGTLVGRVFDPAVGGPSPVVVTNDGVFDISSSFALTRDLFEQADPATAARAALANAPTLGTLDDIVSNTPRETRNDRLPWLLAPVDLQALKAAGVTFAVSMIERVIEERVRGDAAAANELRANILSEIGADLHSLKPGSPEALALKKYLSAEGLWSQYLEVGIGADAEIFTKGSALSAVGAGGQVGVLSSSTWNNPEPEVALIINSRAEVVGATLGNDVNLRDVEGRSALLLPKAKDNNASCGLGAFIRVFDDAFDLDAVRRLTVNLEVDGRDGFHMLGSSEMRQISRDPLDLVAQLMGPHHQYPDGAVLMLGTMFAPVDDRDAVGLGFTHKVGDIVRISSSELGSLVNQVETSERCGPWQFGVASLMRNLAARKLL